MRAALRCRDYKQLTEALDARRRELGFTHLELDDRSSLQTGYSGKVFCGLRHLGPLSLPMMLVALDADLYLAPRLSAEPPAPAERRTHMDADFGRILAPPNPEGTPEHG